ncbi:MAG: response regulator [Myxococcales bacterium]|nr:response regulator [Myxococcales bacterium]
MSDVDAQRMFFRREIDQDLYLEYRAITRSDHMIDAMRRGIMVVISLNTLFILFDLWVFPEQFRDLLITRIVWNALMVAIYHSPIPRDGSVRAMLACHITGLGLVAVIGGAGGVDSGYAPGLMLLFLGLPVLLPMSPGQAARVVTVSLVALGALPLLSGSPLCLESWGMNMFFPTAAAIECIASCAALERMRIADFLQRREIQSARDELAELDQAKSRFSANVHHELRTPLTLILAPIDAIRSGDFGKTTGLLAETIETMHANGRRLYKLISNLLDLSKLESKLFEIYRAPMDLHELVDDLVTAARGMAERKHISLRHEGIDTLANINADAAAVEKILMNLVGNALKFTPSGGQIVISGEAAPDGVLIHVKDSGQGIPADKLKSVFDRFAQVDGSATRAHQGTGIGLSLALELAQLHGGGIEAKSAGPDLGTTMTLSLPIGDADAGALEDAALLPDAEDSLGLGHSIEAVEAELNLERPASSPGGTSELEGLEGLEGNVERWEDDTQQPQTAAETDAASQPKLGEILIAEDNPDMRRLLATLLGREFRVRTARNGLDALEQISQSAPDLVLTDVMMPEMSGLELCREIKRRDDLSAIPVVLVTSKADHDMQVEGLELGADDYITKPFHPRALIARVRTLVRVRGLQKELTQKNETLQTALDDLKQAEVQIIQSERLAAVGELAAGIAHEVNNPVNFALNAARALDVEFERVQELVSAAADLSTDEGAPDDFGLDRFRHIADSAKLHDLASTIGELSGIVRSGLERTQALVSDLRDFAAPGRNTGQVPNVDIEKGIRSTVHLLNSAMSHANAQVTIEVQDDLPLILADSGALNQVFLNLIKNAADAFEYRAGKLDIRVSHDEHGVRIEFQDDGPGIPADVISQIFDPFFTTKTAGKGTGLGLSISRQIIESHEGSLEVECPDVGGALFVVRLPVSR